VVFESGGWLPPFVDRMPPLVRRFIKTAFGFLIFGIAIGLHVSAAEYLGFGVERHGYIVAHTHMILIGFALMAIMGVALWMFPKPAEGDTRYKPERMVLVYWLVTFGAIARASCEILHEYFAWNGFGIGVFCASSIEAVAVLLFAIGMLPRIRSPREDAERDSSRTSRDA
jgi:uncharacterized membrane protein YidH (DUF202 family)